MSVPRRGFSTLVSSFVFVSECIPDQVLPSIGHTFQLVFLYFIDVSTPEQEASREECHKAPFVCPYCGECTMEQFFSVEGCPKQTHFLTNEKDKVLFPYLNLSGINEADKIDLVYRMKSKTSEIMVDFCKVRT